MRIFIGFLVGLALGGLMTAVPFSQTTMDYLNSAAPLNVWFETIHTPGYWMIRAWHSMGLPPRGDAGFVLFAFIPVVQWTFIGTLTGSVFHIRHLRRKSNPALQPTATRRYASGVRG